jgi:hypothetical protein
MSRSPPPGTVVPDVLDSGKVDELYDKYEIALLEFQGCDELLKTKKISAEKRKVSFPLPLFRCLIPNNMTSLQADKQRYRNKMNHAKRAISNMGLDRKCFNISMLELNTDIPLQRKNGPRACQMSPPVWPVILA